MKYTKTKNKKKFSVLLLTYKHGQFHWTRGASKLAVCFVLFFFLFSSSSFSPSVKGVPLPIGKSRKKKTPGGIFFS
jgi:hypothetical protein